MVNGQVVAESWADLTDGTLVHGIDRTLAEEEVHGYPIWTSTLPNGEAWEDKLSCESWSTSWPEEHGRQGISGYTDSRWKCSRSVEAVGFSTALSNISAGGERPTSTSRGVWPG